MSAHPLHTQRRAAHVLGRMVARGLLSLDECLPALTDAATAAHPEMDRRGAQTELSWELRDSAKHELARLANLERDLTFSLRPLAGQPGAVIMAKAGEINAKLGHPLRPDELLSAARRIVFAQLRAAQSPRGRRHARG